MALYSLKCKGINYCIKLNKSLVYQHSILMQRKATQYSIHKQKAHQSSDTLSYFILQHDNMATLLIISFYSLPLLSLLSLLANLPNTLIL